MTMQQIVYALTIAETHSINKAAEQLYISQPALTKAIKALEFEIGITIFKRTSMGVEQTIEGEDFLQNARTVYLQYKLLTDKYGNCENIKRKFGVSTQHYSFAVKAFVETVKKFDPAKYDFAIRETQTFNVIHDVGGLKSEIGILYISDFNRQIIEKMLSDNMLEFHFLIECKAYVYMFKDHPLAHQKYVSMSELDDYPCLSFEQGEYGSLYFSEEILSEKEYPRIIKACDRATMMNLMVGVNGYTLCSGIICEELNGSEFIAVPFKEDEKNHNSIMQIGYITKKNTVLSKIGEIFIDEVKNYLLNYNSQL